MKVNNLTLRVQDGVKWQEVLEKAKTFNSEVVVTDDEEEE